MATAYVEQVSTQLKKNEELLKRTEEKKKNKEGHLLEMTKHYYELKQKLEKFDTSAKTKKEILEIISFAIGNIAQMKKQWNSLSDFFKKMEVEVQAHFGENSDLQTFVERVKRFPGMTSERAQAMMRMKLINGSYVPIQMAENVRAIANCYEGISQDVLMPAILNMGVYHAITDENKLKEEMEEAQRKKESMENQIGIKIEQSQQELQRSLQMHSDTVQNAIQMDEN